MCNKFNVGDRVFSLSRGWGVVESVTASGCWPLICVFKGFQASYLLDGRFHCEYKHPSLFTEAEARAKFPEYYEAPPPEPKYVVKDLMTLVTTYAFNTTQTGLCCVISNDSNFKTHHYIPYSIMWPATGQCFGLFRGLDKPVLR